MTLLHKSKSEKQYRFVSKLFFGIFKILRTRATIFDIASLSNHCMLQLLSLILQPKDKRSQSCGSTLEQLPQSLTIQTDLFIFLKGTLEHGGEVAESSFLTLLTKEPLFGLYFVRSLTSIDSACKTFHNLDVFFCDYIPLFQF